MGLFVMGKLSLLDSPPSPAPAWMGFISYDHAWVRPSHPDRAQHDIRQFHKDNPDGIPA
jgi:hypothetical protein